MTAPDYWSSTPRVREVVPGTFLGNEEHERSPFLTPHVGNGEHAQIAPRGADLFLDIAALLDGELPEPPTPVLGRRTDGHALFYGGQVNLIFGDPECGKTLLAEASIAEALAAGRRVLMLDMDHNGAEATLSRLLMLGAPVEALRDRTLFRYVEPDDETHLRAVMVAAIGWRPAVAVVDSVGELLPILRLSSNSPDDFTVAHTTVLKPLARVGAAVLAIDHLAKNSDSRAAGPTGTAAKRRAVGGASIRVTLKDPFAPGRGGRAALTVHKDRHGGLRRFCPKPDGAEVYAGTFIIETVDEATSWHIAAPRDSDQAPGQALAADVAALSALDPEPESVRDVKDRMRWGSTRASEAFRQWQQERSPFPTHRGRNGEQVHCDACGGLLTELGATTHATCQVAP